MHFFHLLLAILGSLAVATAASLPHPTTPPPPPQKLKVTAYSSSGINDENTAGVRDSIRHFHSELPVGHPSRHAASARLITIHGSGHLHVEFFDQRREPQPSNSLGEDIIHGQSPLDKSLRLHPQFYETVEPEDKRIVMEKVMELYHQHDLAGHAKSVKVISHGPYRPSLVSFYNDLNTTPEHHIRTFTIPAEVKPAPQTVRLPEWGNKQ